MQELLGNKHFPSTQRRKTLTEMGKKASVEKAFLNGDVRKRNRAPFSSAFCIGEDSSCASELCHNTDPESTETSHLFVDGAVAGLPGKICLVLGPWSRDEQDNPSLPTGPQEITKLPVKSHSDLRDTSTSL